MTFVKISSGGSSWRGPMADHATRKLCWAVAVRRIPWTVLVVKTINAWLHTELPELTCSDTAFIRFHHKPRTLHKHPRPQPLPEAYTHRRDHKQIYCHTDCKARQAAPNQFPTTAAHRAVLVRCQQPVATLILIQCHRTFFVLPPTHPHTTCKISCPYISAACWIRKGSSKERPLRCAKKQTIL